MERHPMVAAAATTARELRRAAGKGMPRALPRRAGEEVE